MSETSTITPGMLKAIEQLFQSDVLSDSNILNLLPVAVYVCDKEGRIVNYNKKAVELWGRTPKVADTDEKFCGSLKLFHLDGKPMPHNETPAAACLADWKPRSNLDVLVERPDGSRIIIRATIVPIMTPQGCLGIINCFSDVTKEKSALKDLEIKKQELQDYVDNASIGLHWVNGEGKIIWANKAELNMLGYEEDEYIGHHISEFHVRREKIEDILHRLTCNETLNLYESELKCKDGSIRHVQINSNVLWQDEKFHHTRCFTIDVTEQKKLFAALENSEERYKQLIENLETPLYTTDNEGRITLFNRSAANLWGREPEIGKDLWCGSFRIVNPDGSDMPLDTCPMARCLKNKEKVLGEEIIVVRPDGSLRNVAPHPQPVFDETGEMVGAINMLVDITDRKKAEEQIRDSELRFRQLAASLEKTVQAKTADLKIKNEELKKSEEKYHKMVDEVEDYAIILLDADGIVLNWNKGAQKIKGYSEAEIVGKHFREFYTEEDRNMALPEVSLDISRKAGKAVHEGWRVRKDGSLFWGSVVLTALHGENNEIIGFSKVTRDLTERKLTEDRLQEYTSQLEFQNRELEQFAYAASHDMKEPLRKIHLYNLAIVENSNNVLDEKSKEFLTRSVKAVHRMMNLIEDLLTYSKTTSNWENFEKISLHEVIDEVLLSFKEEIEQKSATIIINGPLYSISGVPFQVNQLFTNLIGNAIKYKHASRDPAIIISCLTINGHAIEDWAAADKQKKYVKISVADNGIGFNSQFSEKIFDMFQRLNNSPDARGSGIGLSICKRIVQNHHGFIKASAKENVGAQFDIYFPRID